MSRPEVLHAHAMFMRARAAVLQHGDEEAQRHAADLQREADEIDPQHEQEEEAS